jgi:death on curing protein
MPRPRREPHWLTRVVIDAVHLDIVLTHGGLRGLRDENALESSLARPRNAWGYGRKPDLAALAAGYGFGLARNHPFHDGNKRIAFLAMVVFLGLNGKDLDAPEAEVVATMLKVASGDLTESALARWVREHLVPYVED